jgi:membrane complex biogenesis BtpA family protein
MGIEQQTTVGIRLLSHMAMSHDPCPMSHVPSPISWRASMTAMDAHRLIDLLFGVPRALIGVVHTGGLPGTPGGGQSIGEIVDRAVAEARLYASAGFHGVAIENTHDRPYLKGAVGPEIVAAMTAVGLEIRRATSLPLGIQVLAAANQGALAVALACGAAFIRVEGFVFAHVADEGLIESSAGALLRYRRAIGAESVRVFADVKKKHSAHALTADVDLAETAKAAEFFLADGVIVTGTSTGSPADPADVRAVAAAVSIPTLIGSGITSDNVTEYPGADALIVGSSVKEGGVWSGRLDESRTRALARAFHTTNRS